MERLEKERADRKKKALFAKSPKKKAIPKEPAAPAGPSKYMDKLLCMNFIALVHKYDQFVQPKKRVEAVTMTKKELTRRFMKLYRIFRHKKYGEPLHESQNVWSIHDDPPLFEDHMPSPLREINNDIHSQLSEIEKYLNRDKDADKNSMMAISDLHTVKEDEDDEEDEDMNPAAYVHN